MRPRQRIEPQQHQPLLFQIMLRLRRLSAAAQRTGQQTANTRRCSPREIPTIKVGIHRVLFDDILPARQKNSQPIFLSRLSSSGAAELLPARFIIGEEAHSMKCSQPCSRSKTSNNSPAP